MTTTWDDICFDAHRDAMIDGERMGHIAGSQAGWEAGYDVGRSKGFEYGMEIGFCRGVLEAVQRSITNSTIGNNSNNVNHNNKKIQKTIADLQQVLEEFPTPKQIFQQRIVVPSSQNNVNTNKDDDDVDDGDDHILDKTSFENEEFISSPTCTMDVRNQLQRVRARFKLLMVQLGMSHMSLKQIMDDAAATMNTNNNASSSKKDGEDRIVGEWQDW